MKYYKICRVKCHCCGDVVEHVNQSKDDNHHITLYCSCGKVGLDPSATLYRIVAAKDGDFTDLSEEWEE